MENAPFSGRPGFNPSASSENLLWAGVGRGKEARWSVDRLCRPAWCGGEMIIYHSEFILTVTTATFSQWYRYSGNHTTHAAALIPTTIQWDINVSCFTDEETETQKLVRVSELISIRAKIQIAWLQNLQTRSWRYIIVKLQTNGPR